MTCRTVVVAGALLAVAFPLAAEASAPGLEFVSPEEIAATSSDDATDEVSVWLRNTTDDEVTPEFTALLEDSDGDAVGAVKVVVVDDVGQSAEPAALSSGGVARYRVKLTGAGLDEDVSGELVAAAPPTAPATLSLSALHETTENVGVNWTIWLGLIFAAVTMVGSLIYLDKPLGGDLPPAALDFGASFASTLTLLGALLGTALSAGVLPDDAAGMEGFTALNLLFGIAVVVAGAVSAALPPKVWGYLVAAFITMWAVFGELLTLAQVVDLLAEEHGVTGVSSFVFRGLLAIAGVAAAIYIARRLRAIGAVPTGGVEAAAAVPGVPTAGRIPLL